MTGENRLRPSATTITVGGFSGSAAGGHDAGPLDGLGRDDCQVPGPTGSGRPASNLASSSRL